MHIIPLMLQSCPLASALLSRTVPPPPVLESLESLESKVSFYLIDNTPTSILKEGVTLVCHPFSGFTGLWEFVSLAGPDDNHTPDQS